jgi:hypothetical protein
MVAIPEFPASDNSVQSSPDDPLHDGSAWWIEPDHSVGASPDQVTDLAVIAVDHPRSLRHQLGHSPPELFGRKVNPVLLVNYAVQLDMAGA